MTTGPAPAVNPPAPAGMNLVQPRKIVDARNVLAERQQPYLVVAPRDHSVAVEQQGRVEGFVVDRVERIGADDERAS